jgi:SAM-dependent methyltransferase
MTGARFLSLDYHSDEWFEPRGWQELLMTAAAVEVDLFTALSAPSTADGLAARLRLDRRALGVLLEALAQTGYLTNAGGRFFLSELAAARFGDRLSPDYLGWAVLHSARLVKRWLTLPEVLKTGRPVPGDRFAEGVEGFIRAMDVYAAATAEKVVDLCLAQLTAAASALDVGGATGTVSKVFSERGLKVTLFDTPEAVETVREELAVSHPGITPIGGDFNEALPEGPFDIAFLGNVTHIYGPEKNRVLFRRVFERLSPGGLIAVLDFVRGRSPSAALFGVNMLVNTEEGGTWTEPQYEDWLTGAGFSEPEVIDLEERDQQLILAQAENRR